MSNYERYEQKLKNLNITEKQKSFLDRLDEAINKHVNENETELTAIATTLNLHPSKLRRDIKAATGITPSHYISFKRFGKVLEMMRESTHYSMAEIAERCGFADHAHFTHSFRRMFDTTPLHYKKQWQLSQIS